MWGKMCLWVLYWIFVGFEGFFILIRFWTLCSHSATIQEIVSENTFPSTCCYWTLNNCTRIVQKKASCVRQTQDNLVATTTAWNKATLDLTTLNSSLLSCILSQKDAKLQSPDQSAFGSEPMSLIHVSFISTAFGFQDDTYIGTASEDGVNFINLQSEARVGQSDFGQNSAHISAILQCLDTGLTKLGIGKGYQPCQ